MPSFSTTANPVALSRLEGVYENAQCRFHTSQSCNSTSDRMAGLAKPVSAGVLTAPGFNTPCEEPVIERIQEMLEPFQQTTDDLQKMGKDNYDVMVRSYGELNKGLQAITARMTDYSKRAFEDAARAFEQLASVKSFEQAIEIQSQYAKKAYDDWVAEASKLSEMYTELTRDAYRPVQRAAAKEVS